MYSEQETLCMEVYIKNSKLEEAYKFAAERIQRKGDSFVDANIETFAKLVALDQSSSSLCKTEEAVIVRDCFYLSLNINLDEIPIKIQGLESLLAIVESFPKTGDKFPLHPDSLKLDDEKIQGYFDELLAVYRGEKLSLKPILRLLWLMAKAHPDKSEWYRHLGDCLVKGLDLDMTSLGGVNQDISLVGWNSPKMMGELLGKAGDRWWLLDEILDDQKESVLNKVIDLLDKVHDLRSSGEIKVHVNRKRFEKLKRLIHNTNNRSHYYKMNELKDIFYKIAMKRRELELLKKEQKTKQKGNRVSNFFKKLFTLPKKAQIT
jgi:hypothetical protein